MKVLQINTVINSGSTGRLAEDIGKVLIANGHDSYIAYGRGDRPSESEKIKIGNKSDTGFHVFKTRIFDMHGFGSRRATNKLITKISEVKPDIIHLHNIHGYYINIEILFKYLARISAPIVWTLHDCWPFTGHCAHFERVNCYKWQNICNKCPLKRAYPSSYIFDNSRNNYNRKKELFNLRQDINIITPSLWLKKLVQMSFLKILQVRVINNGIDLTVFKPDLEGEIHIQKKNSEKRKYIIGVANVWTKQKGIDDFILLRSKLKNEIEIVLIGLGKGEERELPTGITGISKTENVNELAKLYSNASAFVNPTYVDNFPTTNIEALACGTPVITYDTGGSPEAVDNETGFTINKGDVEDIARKIEIITSNGKEHYIQKCRKRAERYYGAEDMCNKYLNIYSDLLQTNN